MFWIYAALLDVQGLSAGCIYVGSGDPVRVLHLSHNKYAGYTLKHLLLKHMYNLPLPKLHATLLVDLLSPESANERALFSAEATDRMSVVLYCMVA